MNREEIHAKYGGRCAYCGEKIKLKQMQVDHIISKSRFNTIKRRAFFKGHDLDYGVDDIRNLNPACRVCNLWKTVFTVEEFRREIKAQIERANKYSRNYRMALRYGLVKPTGAKVIFWFERLPTPVEMKINKTLEETDGN